MEIITLYVDDDDARSIHEAIARYQATVRWELISKDAEPGVFLPEGESDLAGAILGEICRTWLDTGM